MAKRKRAQRRRPGLGAVRPADPHWLADWLEVQALKATDCSVSSGDLQSWLRIQSVGEADGDQTERREALLVSVFTELDRRARAASYAYPFEVQGSVLRLRGAWNSYSAYSFCLLVSFGGVKRIKSLDPARLFEAIATIAARQYLNGRAETFGFPRPKLPKPFAAAVQRICTQIGEGQGVFLRKNIDKRKDGALDLVAWQPFPDRLSGKIIIFGQCAAGKLWEKKKTDLDPDAFRKKWIRGHFVLEPAKAFFIPHTVPHTDWDEHSYDAGLIFDRCRIAYLNHQVPDNGTLERWSSEMLKRILQ